MRRTRHTLYRAALLSSATFFFSAAAMAQGLPMGGAVQAGSARIGAPSGNALTVTQTSKRAVVNWNSFNVGAGNSVTFQQPGKDAAILNRVTGNRASNVAGGISANGQVYLVNPNGIQITPGGSVDAKGGFIASTLGIGNRDFMAGRDRFTGNGRSASVVNQGRISTGDGGRVALIGGSVSNEGTIVAPLGKVGLGAGEAATLDLSGDGFLQVTVPSDATDADGKPLVSNSGQVEAAGGVVELKAATVRAALRDAVNMSGSIRARSVSGRDGAVVLGMEDGATRVSGTVDVSGEARGGRIDITGSDVALRGAHLDASGGDSGGLVRVGGAYQGGKTPDASAQDHKFVTRFGALPKLASAQTVSADATTRIDISARKDGGQGGAAIVWSERNTTMLASVDARALGLPGAIEISSRNAIQTVNLGALKLGRGGTLLLDPQDIEIVDAPSAADVAQNYDFADDPNSTNKVTLRGQDIMDILDGGVDVTLKASRDITWTTAGLATTGRANLTLDAGRSVTINGYISLVSGGVFNIIANDTAAAGVVNADRSAGAADIDLTGATLDGAYAYSSTSTASALNLTLRDGSGNTQNTAGAIKQGAYTFYSMAMQADAGRMEFSRDLFTENLSLTGNIHLLENGNLTIGFTAMQSFAWTNQYSATITSSATNGTRFSMGLGDGSLYYAGRIRAADATRLNFGTGNNDIYNTVYGEAYPTYDDVRAAHPVQFTIDPNSAVQTLADAPGSILSPANQAFGFDAIANPYLPVGQHALAFRVLSDGAIRGSVTGSYLLKSTGPAVYTLNITPRPLTVIAAPGAYTYGAPPSAALVTLAVDDPGTVMGLVNGDTVLPIASVSGIAGGQAMVDEGAGYRFADRMAAGNHTYTITGFGGAQGGNYMVLGAQTPQTLTISPALLTPTVSAGNYTYGAPDALVSLAGVLSGDTVAPVATVSGVAGSQTLVANGADYGFAERLAAGNHTYTLTGVSGADGGNYTLDLSGTISAALNIAPKAISFANCCAVTATYGTLATPDLSLSGVLPGDDVAAATTVTGSGGAITLGARTAAGAYTISSSGLTGAAAGNYSLTGPTSFALTIDPLAITYSAGSGTVNYGNTFGGTVSLTGVLPGDTVTAALGVKQGGNPAADYTQRTDAGTYQTVAGTLGGASAANYTIAASGNAPGTLTINPLTLNYVLHDATTTYGAVGAPSVDLSGVLFGDDVSAAIATNAPGGLSSTTFVGSYTASVTGLTGAKAGNYVLGTGNASSTLTVLPRSLTYLTESTTSVYGDQVNAPSVRVTFSGLASLADALAIHPVLTIRDAGGNTVSTASLDNTTYLGATLATMANNLDAGRYTVSVTAASNDVNRPVSNYAISGSGNTLADIVVNRAPLTATLVQPGGAYNLTYGSDYQIGMTVDFTGFAPGEYGVGRMTMRDAGGNAVALGAPCCSPLAPGAIVTAGTAAGSYTLTVTDFTPQGGVKLSNYDIVSSNTTALTLAPKALTWQVGAAGSTYGTLASLGANLTGVFSGDAVSAGTFTVTPNGGGAPLTLTDRTHAGSYTVAVSGLTGAAASNYVLAGSGNSTGTLTIAPKAITWSVSDASTTYGLFPAPLGSATLNGVLSGDDVAGTVEVFAHNASPLVPGASFVPTATTDANTYAMFVTGLSGAKAGNYVINSDASLMQGGTLTIAPRDITLQVKSETVVYGSAYAPSLVSTLGFLGGDASLLQVSFNAPVNPDAGTYSVTGYGYATPNYNVTVQPGVLTVTPVMLKYSTGSYSYNYGDLADAATRQYLNSFLTASFETLAGTSAFVPGFEVKPFYYAGSPSLPLDQRVTVGSYPLIPVSASPNYSFVAGTQGYLTITPKPLTIAPATSIYGARPGFAADGVLAGDDLSFFAGGITGSDGKVRNLVNMWRTDGSLASSDAPPVDSYTVQGTLAGLQGNNYSIANTPRLTITPKPITITGFNAVSTTYGDTFPVDAYTGLSVLPGGSVQYGGLVYGGDAVGLSPYMKPFGTPDAGTRAWLLSPGITDLAAVFNGRITPCAAIGCVNRNYVLTGSIPASAPVTINPRPVTYRLADVSSVYGDPVTLRVTFDNMLAKDYPNLGASIGIYTASPFNGGVILTPQAVNGAPFNDGQGGFAGPLGLAPAGTYRLLLNGLTGAAAGNYQLPSGVPVTQPFATFTVAPRPITYATESGVLYYGVGAINGSMDKFGLYTLNGVLAADPVLGSLSILRNGQSQPAANLGPFVQPGTYQIVVSSLIGNDKGNYVLATSGNSIGTLTSVDTLLLNQLSFLGSNAGSALIQQANDARAAARAAAQNAANDISNTVALNPPTVTGGTNGPTAATLTTAPGLQTFDWAVFPADTSTGSATLEACGNNTCGGATVSYDGSTTFNFNNVQMVAQVGANTGGSTVQVCGGGTCTATTNAGVVLGADLSASTVVTGNALTGAGNIAIGAGASASGSFGYADDNGAVDTTLGVSVGQLGAGGSFGIVSNNGFLEVSLSGSLDIGIGIDFELKFAINKQAFTDIANAFGGWTTSYEAYADPVAAQARIAQGEAVLAQAQNLAQSQQQVVSDLLSGRFNSYPEGFAQYMAVVRADETRISANIASQQFTVARQPDGTVTVIDRNPPAMQTVTVHHDGVFDAIAGLF